MAALVRMTPAEESRQAEVMSVALHNPDRRGDASPRAAMPLWQWVRRSGVLEELGLAGEQYEEISRKGKRAMGIGTPGASVLQAGELDDATRDAREALSLMRYKVIIGLLRSTAPRAYSVVERVCYDHRPPGPYDEGVLRQALWELAVEFGILKLFSK